MSKCTILVNSCDKYEDTWHPFFTLIEKYWKPIPYPIVLNTESKSYNKLVGGVKVSSFQLYPAGSSIQWGKRLIETLKRIETEYILFLLDDFFIEEEVDQKRIDKCIEWMDKDHSISCFSFPHQLPPNYKDDLYPGFERRPIKGAFRFTCQAGIWRRDKLLSYVRSHESPWDWEYYGTMRSQRYPEDKFYSGIAGEPAIMVYDVAAGGGVHQGKWTKGVVELFYNNGIEVDFSKRGFFKEQSIQKSDEKRAIHFYHRVKNSLHRRLTYFRSVILP